MRRCCCSAFILLLAASSPPARADEEFDALVNEFNAAQAKWGTAYRAARDENPDKEVDLTKLPPRPEGEFRPRFKAYAEKHAGKPEAVPALVWLVQTAEMQDGKAAPEALQALEMLGRNHARQADAKDWLRELMYAPYSVGRKPVLDFYERIARENPDKDTKAAAEYGIAFTLYSVGEAELADASHPDAPASEAEKAARQKARTADKSAAADRFRRIVKEYAGTDAAKAAEGYIFELDYLQIGMIAPDIVGTDADGKEIKLSQFRGQVVVLDFWGFW